MIVGKTAYHTLYDLALTVSKVVDLVKSNPPEIYEPGEHANLEVSIINTGSMPTPPQDIDISLSPTTWIEHKNASLVLTASEHVPIGGSHTFAIPFSFRVKEQCLPLEEPLNTQEILTYHALLRRVNKSFHRISQQKNLFPIRYPVQLSPFLGKACISFNEIVTQSLSIQNTTSAIMGKLGPQQRRIFVTFEIPPSPDIKSSDVELLKIEESDLQELNKVTTEIDYLAPKSEKNLAVSFRFTNPDLPAHSKVCLVASLHLGYFNSESKASLDRTRCIQKRTVRLELR